MMSVDMKWKEWNKLDKFCVIFVIFLNERLKNTSLIACDSDACYYTGYKKVHTSKIVWRVNIYETVGEHLVLPLLVCVSASFTQFEPNFVYKTPLISFYRF